ncbi:MAG: polyphenol oxidase family protein [Actinomycetota bacterium]|nr:polyphenol oxidase family protein [Actinomycetota bacterium]
MKKLVEPVALAPGVDAWFTGRAAGNLSHYRPHLPTHLARSRTAVAGAMGLHPDDVHSMRQVHGATVGVVDDSTPCGAELRGVDALVTAQQGKALVVQVADCVPLLVASTNGPIAAVHAGRRGVQAGVVEATLKALDARGAPPETLRAVIGPAIRGCCYELPAALRDEVASERPEAAAVTSWGRPSLDLPTAVAACLSAAGVDVLESGGARFGCTHCDRARRWFSHRADPQAGRQIGAIVRWNDAGSAASGAGGAGSGAVPASADFSPLAIPGGSV